MRGLLWQKYASTTDWMFGTQNIYCSSHSWWAGYPRNWCRTKGEDSQIMKWHFIQINIWSLIEWIGTERKKNNAIQQLNEKKIFLSFNNFIRKHSKPYSIQSNTRRFILLDLSSRVHACLYRIRNVQKQCSNNFSCANSKIMNKKVVHCHWYVVRWINKQKIKNHVQTIRLGVKRPKITTNSLHISHTFSYGSTFFFFELGFVHLLLVQCFLQIHC